MLNQPVTITVHRKQQNNQWRTTQRTLTLVSVTPARAKLRGMSTLYTFQLGNDLKTGGRWLGDCNQIRARIIHKDLVAILRFVKELTNVARPS